MQISEVSRRSGFSIDTLRYYEKIGLLSQVSRDAGNRRVYGEGDLLWLSFIAKLKATDMPLEQIRQYSDLRKQGEQTSRDRRLLLEDHLEKLDRQISELKNCREALALKVAFYLEKEDMRASA